MIVKYLHEKDQYRFYPIQEGDTGLLASAASRLGWRRSADGSLSVPGFQLESIPKAIVKACGLGPPTRRKTDPWNLLHVPDALRLYPFQVEDVLNMVEPGGWGCWLDCGLGKTVEAIVAYRILRRKGLVDGILVIGPEAGRHAWCKSSNPDKLSIPEKFLDEEGVWVKRGKDIPTSGIVYVTGDKTFRAPYFEEISARLKSKRWILCIDECHLFSGAFSKRFNILDLWAEWCPWRWLMSGTWQSNYPDTAWPIYRLITRSDVTLEEWTRWFGKSDRTWREDRLAQYGRYQRRFSSVRTKRLPNGTPNPDICPHLPAVSRTILRVPLESRQRELYEQVLKEGRAVFAERSINAQSFWHRLVHLSSIASHPLVSDESNYGTISKLRILEELLRSIGDQKACIWSWHPDVLEWLCSCLAERSVVYHGSVSKTQREQAVYRFNNDPACRYFLGNPSAAGMSLNLQAGSVRIFWDQHWEWHELEQARERIDRIDNVSGVPITEYVLLGAGTIEEVIYEANEAKHNFQRLVNGQDKEAIWTSPVVGNIFERWNKQ